MSYDPDLGSLSTSETRDLIEATLDHLVKCVPDEQGNCTGYFQLHFDEPNACGVAGTACIQLLIKLLREELLYINEMIDVEDVGEPT